MEIQSCGTKMINVDSMAEQNFKYGIKNKDRDYIILILSMPLAVLVILTSAIGIFTPDFYSRETLNWQAQTLGQDIIDLFLITPCLIITSIFAFKNYRTAKFLWAGVVLYLLYTFIIYCFDVRYNRLFILYCIILGLSFYSFMYFLFKHCNEEFFTQNKKSSLIKFTAIYFLVISVAFYFLWMSELLPSVIQNTTPQSLIDVGLFSNPVHVIDLSVFLPGIFLLGVFLIKGKAIGLALAPVILTFFVLMDLTIGFLIVMMKEKGLQGDISLTIMMGVLALLSLAILLLYFRKVKTFSELGDEQVSGIIS